MAQYRLAPEARVDVVDILTYSERMFGGVARQRYRTLLITGFQLVAESPLRLGSKRRDEIVEGYHSFHLRHCRSVLAGTIPIHQPRHILYYRIETSHSVDILRVLHERMDPQIHLGASR